MRKDKPWRFAVSNAMQAAGIDLGISAGMGKTLNTKIRRFQIRRAPLSRSPALLDGWLPQGCWQPDYVRSASVHAMEMYWHARCCLTVQERFDDA